MKRFVVTALVSLFAINSFADEGMWLLPLLQKLNIKDMQAKGLELTAEDIYSVNGSSLKDAIVIFGNGCTGEVVSADGLLFTNHHCGFGSIQALSSVEHDYLKNGFWAMNRQEELPAPGLTVTFIRSIEDVTKQVLKGVKEDMTFEQRSEKVKTNSKALQEKLEKKNEGKNISIKEFFGGNQYFAFVMEVYKDVRLVGTPPYAVGKFGGETDNWMWPRHTGDFSVFRIYAAPDGITPAEYAKENVPYKAPTHLTISTEGYKEGDFAMIMGFPGSTTRYMTSWEIDQMLETENPNRIYIRGERQAILKERMAADDAIRIKYASKYASSSNYWKNSIGMSRGVKKLGVKGQKEQIEKEFTTWVWGEMNKKRIELYGNALPMIEKSIKEVTPIESDIQILSETLFRAAEIVVAPMRYRNALRRGENVEAAVEAMQKFYKDYDEATDKLVSARMFEVLREMIPAERRPESLAVIDTEFGGDVKAFTENLFDNSAFANEEKFLAAVSAEGGLDAIKKDVAYLIMEDAMGVYNKLYKSAIPIQNDFKTGHRLFVRGLQEMNPEKSYYPDANFTLRLTYGSVLPYSPADGVLYKYYTTIDGVVAKEDPTNPVDFTVDERLKTLHAAQDWGPYADADGTLHTCFLSTNDITGGNSGSPIMNSRGELIGLAFDGNWEAMSGDIAFEPALQRTINVDVRYVLWCIDKLGGAGYLLDEMTIK
ncbi:MAG: S46 family peptidase [Tidjanibacter sp.]|nr:S46 family peptidase [Tidjanibacter sp.]